MSDYIFPYWDDLDYWKEKTKNITVDDSDDGSSKTLED